MDKIIKEAVDKAGGVTALTRELGIKHTAPYSWTRIPADRVVDIERITGIPRQKLRPDLYEGMEPAE